VSEVFAAVIAASQAAADEAIASARRAQARTVRLVVEPGSASTLQRRGHEAGGAASRGADSRTGARRDWVDDAVDDAADDAADRGWRR
jgi:hypothetical protein